MKNVIVYGIGCKSCNEAKDKIEAFAAANNIEVAVVKEKDMVAIMDAGVMSTPGIAIDGTVVHTGSIPSEEQLKGYFL